MKYLKKILTSILLFGGMGCVFWSAQTNVAFADNTDKNGFEINGKYIKDINVFGTEKAENEKNGNQKLVTEVVQNAINRVLGTLSLIAFIMLLIGGFKILSSGGEESGYEKGMTYLKNAAIGLAFIGLSRMIVSLIFYVIKVTSKTTASTNTSHKPNIEITTLITTTT